MRRLIVATALAAALILLVPAGPANSSTSCNGSLVINVNLNGLATSPNGATKYAKAMKLQVARKETGTQRAMVYLKVKNVSSSVVPCYAKWRLHSFWQSPSPAPGIPGSVNLKTGPWHKAMLYKSAKGTFRTRAFRYPAGSGQIYWSLRLRLK